MEREEQYKALKEMEKTVINGKFMQEEKTSLQDHIDMIKAFLFSDLWNADPNR